MTVKPSSVKVPVLSNTKVSIWPAMFTLDGEMQKMEPLSLRRRRANTIPHDIATGRAGGTATVIRSSVRVMIVWIGTPSSI